MTMLDTDRPRRAHRSPIRFRVVAGVLVAVLVVAGCSDDDSGDAAGSDPAAVRAAYQQARNSGDTDALMALYGDDAVITGYPSDSVSVGESEPVATTDEIRQRGWGGALIGGSLAICWGSLTVGQFP